MGKLKISHAGDEEKVIQMTNNIVLDIEHFITRNYDLRKNCISRCIELDGNNIDDSIVNSIFINVKKNYSKATKELVRSLLFSDFVKSYNPFIEFFDRYKENSKSDPVGNIDKIISTITTDTENYGVFIKKWLVSIIASIHGEHSPLVLVLCGGQNTGKTEWFRRLLPDDLKKYYAESKLDAGKDDEILMSKKLIIMDDEMSGKSKKEEKYLKNLTSKQTFSVRAPYAMISEDLNRIAVLGGTSNPLEVLNDPTGNRRLLPGNVIEIDHELYNSINKNDLFYEIYLEYKNGYKWRLEKQDIEMLNDSTFTFYQSAPEEELLSKYFGVPDENTPESIISKMTSSEILAYIQNNTQIKLSQTKLGLILKNMGLQQRHVKINKTTIRKYNIIQLDLSTSVNKEEEITPKKYLEIPEITTKQCEIGF